MDYYKFQNINIESLSLYTQNKIEKIDFDKIEFKLEYIYKYLNKNSQSNFTNLDLNIKILSLFNNDEVEKLPFKLRKFWEKLYLSDIYPINNFEWLHLVFILNNTRQILTSKLKEEYSFDKNILNQSIKLYAIKDNLNKKEKILDNFSDTSSQSSDNISDSNSLTNSPNSLPINIPEISTNINFNNIINFYRKSYKTVSGFDNLEMEWNANHYIYSIVYNYLQKKEEYIFSFDEDIEFPKEGLYLLKYFRLNITDLLDYKNKVNYYWDASSFDWNMLPLLKFCQINEKNFNPDITLINKYFPNELF